MILRRLYIYIVSIVSLLVLVVGLSLLGATILLFPFNDPNAQDSRSQLAIFAAMTLVAAPVWSFHFWLGRRFALRDPAERAAALRRLYLYLACLGLALAAADLIGSGLQSALQRPLDGGPFNGLFAAQAGWGLLVVLAMFALHFRTAGTDRAVVGEQGASATLRRWYMYPAQLAGLVLLLVGVSELLSGAALNLFGRGPVFDFSAAPASLVAGGLLWGFHARLTATEPLKSDDLKSTLRAVAGFAAVFITIAVALVSASQALQYGLTRLLGVPNLGEAWRALSGPLANLLVFGVAWYLVRRRLQADAAGAEAHRQAGVRRLYTNLASLVSLATLGVGAAGLLWTALEQLEAKVIRVDAPDWRDPVAIWVTVLAAGVAVWLLHWQRAPAEPERAALSRRIYVYAALVGSVLAVLASAIGMIDAVLRQLVSTHPHLDDPANLDFGRFLGILVVAVVIGWYHWRVLRADGRARPAPETRAEPMVPPPPAPAIVRLQLEVVGAQVDDVRRALASLPAGASYKLGYAGERSSSATDSM